MGRTHRAFGIWNSPDEPRRPILICRCGQSREHFAHQPQRVMVHQYGVGLEQSADRENPLGAHLKYVRLVAGRLMYGNKPSVHLTNGGQLL